MCRCLPRTVRRTLVERTLQCHVAIISPPASRRFSARASSRPTARRCRWGRRSCAGEHQEVGSRSCTSIGMCGMDARGIDQNPRAVRVDQFDIVLGRVTVPRRWRHASTATEFVFGPRGPRTPTAADCLHRHRCTLRSHRSAAKVLPGNDIGVVLQWVMTISSPGRGAAAQRRPPVDGPVVPGAKMISSLFDAPMTASGRCRAPPRRRRRPSGQFVCGAVDVRTVSWGVKYASRSITAWGFCSSLRCRTRSAACRSGLAPDPRSLPAPR